MRNFMYGQEEVMVECAPEGIRTEHEERGYGTRVPEEKSNGELSSYNS